jgi:hypothetical protein
MPVVPELKRRVSGEGTNVARHPGKTWRQSGKPDGRIDCADMRRSLLRPYTSRY